MPIIKGRFIRPESPATGFSPEFARIMSKSLKLEDRPALKNANTPGISQRTAEAVRAAALLRAAGSHFHIDHPRDIGGWKATIKNGKRRV